MITGDSAYDIVKQFRSMIGRSYIPPKFAFGFGQSRWGYKTREDFEKVAREHRNQHIPLDMIYMDIDYMEDCKDFTVNTENFPDFKAFIEEMIFVLFKPDGSIETKKMEKGSHYIPVALNEVPLFIRKGKCIPVFEAAESVAQLDTEHLTMLGYEDSEYLLYEDDGVGKDYENVKNVRKLKK